MGCTIRVMQTREDGVPRFRERAPWKFDRNNGTVSAEEKLERHRPDGNAAFKSDSGP